MDQYGALQVQSILITLLSRPSRATFSRSIALRRIRFCSGGCGAGWCRSETLRVVLSPPPKLWEQRGCKGNSDARETWLKIKSKYSISRDRPGHVLSRSKFGISFGGAASESMMIEYWWISLEY